MMNKLPRGEFSFTYKDQHIKGKFCTWTLARFSDKMNIRTVTDLYNLLMLGMSVKALAELLICAAEYFNREQSYSLDEAYEWIDEVGGIAQVIDMIKTALTVESKDTKDDTKKKVK